MANRGELAMQWNALQELKDWREGAGALALGVETQVDFASVEGGAPDNIQPIELNFHPEEQPMVA